MCGDTIQTVFIIHTMPTWKPEPNNCNKEKKSYLLVAKESKTWALRKEQETTPSRIQTIGSFSIVISLLDLFLSITTIKSTEINSLFKFSVI